MAENRPCIMCSPLSVPVRHFERFGVHRLDTVPLLKTDNFKVIADVLAAADFHALIIPNRHTFSHAMIPDLFAEFGNVVSQLEGMVGENLALLEHGGAGPGANHQSIYHAHVHVMPARLNPIDVLVDDFRKRGVEHSLIDSPDPSPLRNLHHKVNGKNYLFVKQGRGGLLAVDHDGTHPSQQIQRAMGTAHKGEFLNWKEIGDKGKGDELARLSVQQMLSTIQRCVHP